MESTQDQIEIEGDRYLTRDAAAKLLHVHWRTLRRWEKGAYGPRVIRVGLTPYYGAADIRDWLRNGGRRPVGRPRKVQA
jgi:hypothetical protein